MFCWMVSMYQLLSAWNVLFHSLPIDHQRLEPKDRRWKRSTFFSPSFLSSCLRIIVLPVVYIVALFFLAVVILSPLTPRFYSFQADLCNGGPAPTTGGLSAACRLRALPHACAGGDTQRQDGEDNRTSAPTPSEAELWLVGAGGKVRVTVL